MNDRLPALSEPHARNPILGSTAMPTTTSIRFGNGLGLGRGPERWDGRDIAPYSKIYVGEFERGRGRRFKLTELLKHLVAFVKNEMFYIGGIENFVPTKGIETTRSGDNNMRAFCFVLEYFGIFGDRNPTIEHGCADVGHVF